MVRRAHTGDGGQGLAAKAPQSLVTSSISRHPGRSANRRRFRCGSSRSSAKSHRLGPHPATIIDHLDALQSAIRQRHTDPFARAPASIAFFRPALSAPQPGVRPTSPAAMRFTRADGRAADLSWGTCRTLARRWSQIRGQAPRNHQGRWTNIFWCFPCGFARRIGLRHIRVENPPHPPPHVRTAHPRDPPPLEHQPK